jgi:hypothetical protein
MYTGRLLDKDLKFNAVGYQQIISTLTAVAQKVSVQKFYEVPFADYVPVVVGNGSFKRQLINWRTFSKAEDFASGLISNASNHARMDQVDNVYDVVPQNILNWAKKVEYNIFELEEAMQANTLFSLIEARELARKKNWDLGLQKVAFFGIGAETGLLNNAGVSADASNLTGFIKGLSAADFNTFVGKIWGLYRQNTNYTAKATHFIIPELDYNGLISYPDATFPLKTKLELLQDAFKTISGNPNFKILPLAYCNKAVAYGGDGVSNKYIMLNYDETSLKMDLPIQYSNTQSGTLEGFTWTNVAYGQFTGVVMQRPLETYLLTHTA